MSTRWIEIDHEVLELLQAEAMPLIDSPNETLRRLLGLEPLGDLGDPSLARYARRGRRRPPPSASVVPASAYERSILQAIAERHGAAPRPIVIDAVEEALSDSFRPLDRVRLPSGQERWRARIAGARQRLVQRGLLKADSPRGLWELTKAGVEELYRREAEDAGASELLRRHHVLR